MFERADGCYPDEGSEEWFHHGHGEDGEYDLDESTIKVIMARPILYYSNNNPYNEETGCL